MMKKHCLLLLMVWFSNQCIAQLEITPNPLSIQTTPNSGEIIYNMFINNPDDTTYTLFWQLVKYPNWPTEWEVFYCDANLCYTTSLLKCPNNNPNIFPQGLDTFMLHFNPNGIEAISGLEFKFFGGPNMQNEIFSQPFVISTSPSSTSQTNLDDLVLFPNPTAEYFTLTNSKDVDRIIVYNLYGQIIKSFKKEAYYDIRELNTGVYLVNIFNSKKQLIHFDKIQKL